MQQDLLSQIKQLQPEETPNILMIGPVGAGKSSFINSILSIDKGRKCALAATGDVGERSWTLDVCICIVQVCVVRGACYSL